jgi:hypothetical protein
MRHGHNYKSSCYEQLVRQGVEKSAKAGLLLESPRKEAVREIGQARQKKHGQGDAETSLVDEIQERERQENSKERKQIGNCPTTHFFSIIAWR